MVRTQIQLTQQQHKQIRKLAALTGKSMSQLIREAVEQMITSRVRRNRRADVDRAIRAVGRFSSGLPDVSKRHDRHLAEIFK